MRLRLVMALVIGPLVCLAGYFAWHEVREQKGYADRSEIASRMAADASIIADLVHELQKERGYSAGFIASRGSNFPDALAEQRDFTKAAMDAMNAQLDLVFETRPKLIAQAQQQLSQLDDIRGDVDRFALSVPQMAKYYTSTIDALFDVARPSAVLGGSDTLQLLKVSRALLGAAKESAGLERAMGATGLGGGFSPIIYNRFVSLSGRQMALLDEANGLLSGQKWLQDLLESKEYAAISQARTTVKSGFQTEVFPGLTAPKWFDASTRWINLLREKEIQLTSQINSLSLSAFDEAQGAYWNLIYLALVSTALTVLLTVAVFERMIRRVTGLTSAIENFTRGDFETEISGTDGADEISKMAKSVSEFKQETLDMRAKAEALEQEQKDRSKQQDFVVEELRNGLSQLSEGDLTTQIEEKFPEAYETLRADFNETVRQLMETMSTIVDTAGSIRNGAMEISQASDDLSQRTEKQAITLEETASALDGLASSVKSAAERAKSAEGTAGDTKSEALQGGGVVSEAVDAMAQIEDSSNQIVQIIGVIDDIAFQTNLLALNAGVEAARAGEAGRGFAVVAGEVHALAQRSSNAASEIKTLIGESASQVEKGVDLVRKAGEALTGIVERVGEVSSLVSEIAEGAAEQSSGLGEINTGVGQLERVTQQNAGMAEEASAASTLLRSDATKLDRLVQSFKTSDDGGLDDTERNEKPGSGEDDKAAA